MQNKIWPHWMGEPEVVWERLEEERDKLFQEWEDLDAKRENGEKEAA